MPLLKLDPKRCVKCTAVGRQRVVKFRKPVLPGTTTNVVDGDSNSRGDDVIILMCIVRLLDVLTDILITLNVPFIADYTGEGTTLSFYIHSLNQDSYFNMHNLLSMYCIDVVPPLPPSKTASSATASNSGRPDSSRVARAQADAAAAAVARADIKTEASTVVSLLYKAPSPGMILRATTLEDRGGEGHGRSLDGIGNMSGKGGGGVASSKEQVQEVGIPTVMVDGIAMAGGTGTDMIDVPPGAPSTILLPGTVPTMAIVETIDGHDVNDDDLMLSSEDRSIIVVGKALKTYHVLFQRPAVATSSSSTARKSKDTPLSIGEMGSIPTEEEQLPMYPHALLKTVLETFAIQNWQLFA